MPLKFIATSLLSTLCVLNAEDRLQLDFKDPPKQRLCCCVISVFIYVQLDKLMFLV